MDLYTGLAQLSERYGHHGSAAEGQEDWAGIGFRLGMHRFLVPQDEVAEVMSPPQVTRVPGAAPWVRGLANLRGTVLPLFDLGHLLLGTPTPAQSRNRYLVLDSPDNPGGVLVDAVSGLRRHASSQMKSADELDLPEGVREFVLGCFIDADEQRGVFSLRAVLEHRLSAQFEA